MHQHSVDGPRTPERGLRRTLIPAAAGLALALTPGLAAAQTAYSVDSEYVRPAFGNDSFTAVDVATQRKPLAVRAGLIMMYTRDPVTLYDRIEGTELGAIVTDRATFMVGASLDLSDRVTINALLPAAVNSAGEDGDPKDFEAPGFGLQDIGLSARLTAIKHKNFGLGFRAGLIFPSGARNAYLGDSGFRPNGGLLAHVAFGDALIGTDISVMGRPEVLRTDEDFTAGSELNVNFGYRQKLPAATRLGFTGQVLTRAGFENFLNGAAENGLEGLAGIQVYPSSNVTLDFQAGRGVNQGYGTTDLRVLGGLTIEFVPPEDIPPPPPVVEPPPDPPPPEIPIIEPEPVEETETFVYKAAKIEFKQQPQFVVGTTQLLDSQSRAWVREVAEFVRDKWEIAHIVVEGHASVEGSYEYNYNLSAARARAIWEEFIKAGVHPDRVSFRGRGEVEPRVVGEGEEPLQENRRIEFYVTTQLNPTTDESPEFYEQTVVKAPWNGQPIRVTSPEKPEIEEPEEEPDFFNTDDEIGIGDDGVEIDPNNTGDATDTGDTEDDTGGDTGDTTEDGEE
jgi:outer membrane protein OmpA-like peptidoglycan-associated protein